jgi:hypothetical protein
MGASVFEEDHMPAEELTANKLEGALYKLEDLAQAEYGESLSQIAIQPGDEEEMRLYRLGRLIGVTLKEPFASVETLPSPAPYSRAYRAWHLDQSKFQNDSPWQYQALDALRADQDVIDSLGWKPSTVYDLATAAQYERGFFRFLVVSCRKYLCRNAELRSTIESEIQAAKRAGFDITNVTPEIIVASGGLAIGAQLVASIPVLGIVGAPVIGGLVFIIYSIGIDAFCNWASTINLNMSDEKVLTELDG